MISCLCLVFWEMHNERKKTAWHMAVQRKEYFLADQQLGDRVSVVRVWLDDDDDYYSLGPIIGIVLVLWLLCVDKKGSEGHHECSGFRLRRITIRVIYTWSRFIRREKGDAIRWQKRHAGRITAATPSSSSSERTRCCHNDGQMMPKGRNSELNIWVIRGWHGCDCVMTCQWRWWHKHRPPILLAVIGDCLRWT